MEPDADIALIGLAVMGQNLILNMNDHGFTVVAFNRTPPGSKGVSNNDDLEVWLANADGTGKRLLTHGAGPLVSPSGRWVTS